MLGAGSPFRPRLRAVLPLSPQASHNLGLALLSGLQALTPWRYALKRIGGRFGSSVLSYFLFLKTLLAFNALLLLPLLAFIVGVQAAFPPAPGGPVPAFTGLELLTGGVRLGGGGQRAGAPSRYLPTPSSTVTLAPLAFLGALEAPGWPRSSVHLCVPLTPLLSGPSPSAFLLALPSGCLASLRVGQLPGGESP